MWLYDQSLETYLSRNDCYKTNHWKIFHSKIWVCLKKKFFDFFGFKTQYLQKVIGLITTPSCKVLNLKNIPTCRPISTLLYFDYCDLASEPSEPLTEADYASRLEEITEDPSEQLRVPPEDSRSDIWSVECLVPSNGLLIDIA